MAPSYRLPNATAKVVEDDNTFTQPWYLYLKQLSTLNSGGSGLTSLSAGQGIKAEPANPITSSSGTLVLDLDYFGSTPGSVLVRGNDVWQALAPGVAGQVLTTAGSGGLPFWAAGGGGSGLTGLASEGVGTPVYDNVVGSTALLRSISVGAGLTIGLSSDGKTIQISLASSPYPIPVTSGGVAVTSGGVAVTSSPP